MIKKYNFIIEGKIIDVYAKSKTEAQEKAKKIYDEIRIEDRSHQKLHWA